MDIKRKIQLQGFTISQVAEQMTNKYGGKGVSQPSLSHLIAGNPTLDKLQEIANIIGVTVSDLLADDADNSLTCPHCGKKIKISLG